MRFKDKDRALRLVVDEGTEVGVDMTKEARSILASIKMSKMERIAT